MVRDGVSGPARNQKLLEVQKEDERRDRVFRVLSLLVAGRGPPLRAEGPHAGSRFAFVWSASSLAAVVLTGRLLPVTEAPGDLLRAAGVSASAVAGPPRVYVARQPARAPTSSVMRARPPPAAPAAARAGRPRRAMALEGTIKDFGLPDIFQLIGLQRKTGLLTLKHDEGPGHRHSSRTAWW